MNVAPQRLPADAIFNFETDGEVNTWTGTRERASDYVTNGESSLLVHTDEWHTGMDEWPVWRTEPQVKDWSGFDRAFVDFVNPTPYAELIRFRAADGAYVKIGSGDWPTMSFTVQPRSHLRAVFDLKTWFGTDFDLRDIRAFLFYTTRAPHDYRLYIDNFTLLHPGEEPAPPAAKFRQAINDLRLRQWSLPKADTALKQVEAVVQALREDAKTKNSDVYTWAENSCKRLAASLQGIHEKSLLSRISTEEIAVLGDQADALVMSAQRLASLIQLRSKATAIFGRHAYAVGWANSLQKVLPRDMPISVDVAGVKTIDAARNESESIQLIVVPFDKPLQNCRIEFGAFKGLQGATLPSGSLDVRTVGYVKTKQPAYEVNYVGWWPDPLLDFLPSVSIDAETAQAFWLRVRVPKRQKAGTYSGVVRVVAKGVATTKVQLKIRVHSFEMPDRSPLLLANQISGPEFFNKYSNEDWSTQKIKVTDFLSSYYIGYDNIYRAGPPDFELLQRLKKQGRLSAFSLSTLNHTIFVPNMDDAAYRKAFDKLVSQIEPGYQRAKQDGLLKYAYLYGMDEAPSEQFPILKRLTADLKAKYPDLPIMTSAQDATYGRNSEAKDIDLWTPAIHHYDLPLAKQARADGKKVWWYTCQSPAHPYPNVFTEYPSIDLRLLMGFMAAKMQPDGFLYYCMFRDDGPPRKAIASGPFTTWDPCCFVQPFNGEGYLAYPGSNGRAPMASIRLENFRDGLEDYAYWKILEATIQTVRGIRGSPTQQRRQWLQKAESVLAVPDSLVKNAAVYTQSPQAVYDYRLQIASLLDQSEVGAATPHWPEVR